MSSVKLGPVSAGLRDALALHIGELNYRRSLLHSWRARRRMCVSRAEVRRGVAQMEFEVAALRRAFDIAVDVEGWTAG